MALRSMTGFARVDGSDAGANWHWEIRSVNGRGLDVRLRLPQGVERVEVPARAMVAKKLTRGSVSLQLYLRRASTAPTVTVNEDALTQILELSERLRARLNAPPPTVEGLLALRGVVETTEAEEDEGVIERRTKAQLADLERALEALVDARCSEGFRLGELVDAQLAKISDLVEQVAGSPARTPEAIGARLRELVTRLIDNTDGRFDEARLHQEAVLLASKADIEEELQRLRLHVSAARELLQDDGAVGRRLDFLTQEFNREANTLCSKSNDSDVTRLGLELKAVIEQMREQVQNIE